MSVWRNCFHDNFGHSQLSQDYLVISCETKSKIFLKSPPCALRGLPMNGLSMSNGPDPGMLVVLSTQVHPPADRNGSHKKGTMIQSKCAQICPTRSTPCIQHRYGGSKECANRNGQWMCVLMYGNWVL